MTDNILSRGFTQVAFVDQYGEERVIYRQRGKALRVKKRQDTLSHVLNRAAAELMGQRIKRMRVAKGYTLDGLLARAGLVAAPGLGKSRMYEIENAGKNHRGANAQGIRFGTLYALAMALECEVAELLPSAAEIARHAGVGLATPKEVRVAKAA